MISIVLVTVSQSAGIVIVVADVSVHARTVGGPTTSVVSVQAAPSAGEIAPSARLRNSPAVVRSLRIDQVPLNPVTLQTCEVLALAVVRNSAVLVAVATGGTMLTFVPLPAGFIEFHIAVPPEPDVNVTKLAVLPVFAQENPVR